MINIKKEVIGRIKEWGITPNKTLGQHFLIDYYAYKTIVGYLANEGMRYIIEIGPGLGTLTEFLLSKNSSLIAVEKDPFLCQKLENLFKNQKKIEIVNIDILKFGPLEYGIRSGNYAIVGNIPYYLTSHLLQNIFLNWPRPRQILITIQKEVAQRIVARPPKMNLLAILVQYFSKPKIIRNVKPESFWPKPKVDSAIINIQPLEQSGDIRKLLGIARAGFTGKRKQLVNTLSNGLGLSKEKIKDILISSSINTQERAENLSIEQWQKVCDLFYQQ